MKPPIFIIGNPRSGTTLLRLIVNNHKNIIVPPECGFIIWLYEKYQGWSLQNGRARSDIKCFVSDLNSCKKFETWGINVFQLEDFIISVEPKSYAALVEATYMFFSSLHKSGISQWGDKNNFHVKSVDTINAIFPDSRFIHIVRDGRDVACSYKALATSASKSIYAPNLPSHIKKISQEWLDNNQAAINSFDKIDVSRVLLVRYEDLVSETEHQVRKICSHIGQEYDENMLMYYKKNLEEEQEPKEFLQWKQKTIEKPTISEVGKYKLLLTRDEIDIFNNNAGVLLKRFEYEI